MDKKIFVTRSAMPPYEEFVEKIKPLWDSHWLTNMGEYHRELEAKLAEFLEVPYLSLMTNGHMTLELTIQAMNFPEGSEVITTPFTFISTTHAIVRNGLVPVFCDIKNSDYTIDESKIENLITENTVAILPVHVYGNICNVEKIQSIAEKYGLKVIYDACHSFGEKYKGKGVGTFGDVSIFSFHATKVYNTVEGGAAAFQDKDLYEKLYNLKNFGIRGEEMVESVGANAKMNEMCAIMGLCNLPYVKDNIIKRKCIVDLYCKGLKAQKDIHLPHYKKEIDYCYSYFPILLSTEEQRNHIYQKLRDNNIYARKYFYPLTADAFCFGDKYKDCSLENARNISARVLVLPLYAELENGDVARIIETIIKYK